jgi:predicted oxidoreductase
MSKTTLSPIIAGTGEFGIKPNIKEMLNMIHVCLENKITTFDHADIYGSYTTEGAFGKHLLPAK